MAKRILWIDNDKIFLEPHILRLKAEGYIIRQAFTLTEGLEEIENDQYDLLILDVMMPVREEEEEIFPQSDTNFGRKSGLVFYNRFKGRLENKNIMLCVLTIREDASIRREFLSAGLDPQSFVTKSDIADTADFLAKVRELLGE